MQKRGGEAHRRHDGRRGSATVRGYGRAVTRSPISSHSVVDRIDEFYKDVLNPQAAPRVSAWLRLRARPAVMAVWRPTNARLEAA